MGLYLYYYCYILHYFLGEQWPIVGVATVNTASGIKANVTFKQECCTGPVKVTVSVVGLEACHGFHIHELGDLTGGCGTLGPHWNPYQKDHGSHLGDLPQLCVKGIEGTTAPLVKVYYKDDLQLAGPYSILGRSIVIHQSADDMGSGSDVTSKTTGNSGPRIACGVIGLKSTSTTFQTETECHH